VRASELAQKVAEENRLLKRAREALTIYRRDVCKLITTAMEEDADGDWTMIETMYGSLVGQPSRNPGRDLLEAVLDALKFPTTRSVEPFRIDAS
jgi:replication initiation protein RepC